jgi:hypothetical protein
MAKSKKSKSENSAIAVAEKEKSVTLIKEAGEGTLGVELDKTDEHTCMFVNYFSSLREGPVDRDAIYGETLKHLLAQYEFISRMSGTLGFVADSLEGQMSAEDLKLYNHIEQSVRIISDVILEKFSPKPR